MTSIPLDEPDPGRAATPKEFGHELTLLRERAGLTVRQAASGAGIPVSTAGDYFAGRHLPPQSQAETLRRLVRCCGAGVPEQAELWIQALGRVRRSPGRRPAGLPAPYRGLASFEAEDAEWFFGRDDLIELLTGLAADIPSGQLVTVTGASGSGKSSLLRAGLIARLMAKPHDQPDQWCAVLFTPGPAPMTALTGRLCEVTGRSLAEVRQCLPGSARLAVVVDQFEETFTVCRDEAERQEFIGTLADLAGQMLIVIGLRADFYGQALRYQELASSLQHRQVVVGPMTQSQLRLAITEPARKARLALDPGLADLLISDLAPYRAASDPAADGHEAGTLPLLSHALLATWERHRGGKLTVAGYQAVGGIWNAIARTAEAAYTALGDADQELTRRLFLGLVYIPESGPLARARMPLDELPGRADAEECLAGDRASDDGRSVRVLASFVDERLVTVDEYAAQITHEALLTAWPRLRDWISADRDGLKIRHRIASAATAWQEARRDEALLMRGAPLATAVDWVANPVNRASLRPLGREFLDECVARERALALAERRRVTRLRQLTAVLAALALVAAILTGYAFAQRHAATVARDQADSREVATEAEQIRSQDPSLAAQLSLAAWQISPTQAARGSLLESAAYPVASRFRDTNSSVQGLALAPDRRTLAVVGTDGTLRLWNVTATGHPVPIGRPLLRLQESPLYAVVFSHNGRLLAAAGAGAVIWLFNVADPRHAIALRPPLRGSTSTIYSLAFSRDGKILASGSVDDTVRLWDIADPARPVLVARPQTGPASEAEAVAISPDGKLLAAGSAGNTVRLWDITDPARPRPLGRPLAGPAGLVDTLAFSPDGRTLAAGSRSDHAVWLWNIADPGRPVRAPAPLTAATDWVNAVAFSPDGRTLAAASSDNTVRIWDTGTDEVLATLPGPQPVNSLAWDGDHSVIAGGADGLVRAWEIPTPILLGTGTVSQVTYSPDGKLLAVATNDLELWNTATRTLAASATVPGATVISATWAPSGRLLAAGYSDGKIRFWQIGPGGLTQVGALLTASAFGAVEDVIFRSGGRVLVSTGYDGSVRLWNVADLARPRQHVLVQVPRTIMFSAAFSPNWQILAATDSDSFTWVWNVANPARPRLLGRPLAGSANYALSAAFSPNGRVLAIGSADSTIRLWDLTSPGRPRMLGPPLAGPGSYVYSVAFSPSGRALAASSTDGTVWLWNVADLAAPAQITHVSSALSPTGHVYSVAFSPAGTMLASGSSDGSVRLWDLNVRSAAATLCAAVGQPLTPAEWASYIPGRPYDPPCPAGRRLTVGR